MADDKAYKILIVFLTMSPNRPCRRSQPVSHDRIQETIYFQTPTVREYVKFNTIRLSWLQKRLPYVTRKT